MTPAGAAGRAAMEIRADGLTGRATHALLRLHLEGMHANSPPGEVSALDLSALAAPGVSVWSAWEGETILGIAALRRIDDEAGEVKSMRTHPDHLRKGVAAALLDHLIGEARLRGLRQLRLETGSGPAFEPAVALYRKRGFLPDEAFGDYRQTAFSRFFRLALA